MYDNIGGKIKGLAKASFIVVAIAGIIIGIALMIADVDLIGYGLLVMVIGLIVAWVSSWLLYGFGELVDKACEIEQNTRGGNVSFKEQKSLNSKKAENITSAKETPVKKVETVIPVKNKGSFSCPKCGCSLKKGQKACLCSCELDWSNLNN